MRTEFRGSFLRDLRKLKDDATRQRVSDALDQVAAAETLDQIPDVKKIAGGSNCYRLRIGDYRLGMVIDGETVRFVRCLHRRDIYRHFP